MVRVFARSAEAEPGDFYELKTQSTRMDDPGQGRTFTIEAIRNEAWDDFIESARRRKNKLVQIGIEPPKWMHLDRTLVTGWIYSESYDIVWGTCGIEITVQSICEVDHDA